MARIAILLPRDDMIQPARELAQQYHLDVVGIKANKRHPFSQELGQKNNLIERMYYYGKDTKGNAEGIRGQPEVQ